MTRSISDMDTLLETVPGLRWHRNGQAALSGPLLALARGLDSAFLRLAGHWAAEEHRFPTFLSAAELAKLDYFRSFPQLATFPVTLSREGDNLDRFVAGEAVHSDGSLGLTALDPVREVLTPAACYHLYVHLQGSELDRPLHLTTRNTCFRHEDYYRPLQRQWGFTMREIVCIGTAEEVGDFLERTRAAVDGLLADLDIPIDWAHATDPFFRPSSNAKYLMQKLDPVKQEAVFDDALAIGSVNFHQDHFGGTFAITRDGRPAYSGCVAFGLERWLFAVLARYGTDPRAWPELSTGESDV
jgi:seryl-tRNA synthetase